MSDMSLIGLHWYILLRTTTRRILYFESNIPSQFIQYVDLFLYGLTRTIYRTKHNCLIGVKGSPDTVAVRVSNVHFSLDLFKPLHIITITGSFCKAMNIHIMLHRRGRSVICRLL